MVCRENGPTGQHLVDLVRTSDEVLEGAVRKTVGICWRDLRWHEVIVSGCKVNRLIDGLCGERLPAINLAHVDLS